MTGLKISRGLTLPLDYVTKTGAIIAKRRVGKTYTAAVFAEELVAGGIPWYALDPTEAWWGLRSSADGKKAGLPVIVLGGAHGDVPISEHDGKAIADLIVDEPSFYVIDLSLIDESHSATVRFATAFLDRLYRRKAKAKDPLHGFWDEADMFAPQKPGPDQTRMLGAAESIVRRGGIRGLGTTLITQRAAVLNKNVLTQLDILVMLRTISPQDRNAVDEYVKANATPAQRAAIMDELASLKLGEAWIYGPGEEPELLERVQIRARRTFNSSATPQAGETRIEPTKLADVDLEGLRSRFDQQIEKAKAEDPKLLQQRIRELERDLEIVRAGAAEELARRMQEWAAENPPTEVEVQVPALPVGLADELAEAHVGLRDAETRISGLRDQLREVVENGFPTQTARPAEPAAGDGARGGPPPRSSMTPPPRTPLPREAAPAREPAAQNGEEPNLKAGARRILDEMARIHPLRLTRSQVGLATGMKITGGTFNTYWSTLKRAGYVDESGGDAGITELGLDRAGVVAGAPRTKDEMLAMWSSKLKRGARDMLAILAEYNGETISRQTLADMLDMTASGGTFNTYLSTLRRNGLITVDGISVGLNRDFFAIT